MGLIPRRPRYPLPTLEEPRWRKLAGDFAPELVDYFRKLIAKMNESYNDVYIAFLKSWYSKYSEADVTNPPTDAELDAIFGLPSQVGAGFTAVVNDAGAGSNEYFVWSDGTSWWYASGTKAT